MSKRNIVHFELPSKDREQTKKFYSELFGFEFTVVEQFDYYMFSAGNTTGGLAPLRKADDEGPAVNPDDVVVYLGSEDIDADLVAIKAKGGSVVEPKMEVPGSGFLAVFTDPTGNRIGLWQPVEG